MESLYLVRHGQTRWNAEERMQGWLDSDLTVAGREHAERNAELLEREKPEALLVSPLGRARCTAEIISARLGVPVGYDERLKERNCGAWEGLTMHDIEERWPEEIAERKRDPFLHRPPGGENLPDMMRRVSGLLDEIRDMRLARLAIISHGMIGRAMLTCLLDLAAEVANTVRQPNDLVFRISFDASPPRCAHYRAGVGPIAGLFVPG